MEALEIAQRYATRNSCLTARVHPTFLTDLCRQLKYPLQYPLQIAVGVPFNSAGSLLGVPLFTDDNLLDGSFEIRGDAVTVGDTAGDVVVRALI